MAGERTLLRFYYILRNYDMSNVENCPQISAGGRVHFSLPFPTYFTLETKNKFGTTRAEKGVEDNFITKHPYIN